MLITFEGGEGAGKTTLIQNIYEYLITRNKNVVLTRAPGGTEIGALLRDVLLHRVKNLSLQAELFLFLADRGQHVHEIILPALAQGNIVLCDRFNDSTIAYQGGARDFGFDFVRQLCHFATQNLEPSLTLYLDIDPVKGLQRGKSAKDRIEQEKLAFHQKIRATYLEIAHKEPERFFTLDAALSREEVFLQAKRVLDKKLDN